MATPLFLSSICRFPMIFGIPKSLMLMVFSKINHQFWGTSSTVRYPSFRQIQMVERSGGLGLEFVDLQSFVICFFPYFQVFLWIWIGFACHLNLADHQKLYGRSRLQDWHLSGNAPVGDNPGVWLFVLLDPSGKAGGFSTDQKKFSSF